MSQFTYKIPIYQTIVVFFIFFTCACSSLDGPSTGNTPADIFAAVVSDSVGEVMQLQGTGDTWQGYNVYLRFKEDGHLEKTLIKAGYLEVNCNLRNFSLPNRNYDIFKQPTWGDLNLEEGKCYEKNQVKNKWTHSGTHYFHINPINQMVHFHGIGS